MSSLYYEHGFESDQSFSNLTSVVLFVLFGLHHNWVFSNYFRSWSFFYYKTKLFAWLQKYFKIGFMENFEVYFAEYKRNEHIILWKKIRIRSSHKPLRQITVPPRIKLHSYLYAWRSLLNHDSSVYYAVSIEATLMSCIVGRSKSEHWKSLSLGLK